MKKTLLLFACSFVLSMSASAQAVMQGNILIDAYYGFPDLYKTTFRTLYEDNSDVKVGGIGPIGGRVEYLLSDKFGVGLDVAYTSANATFNRDEAQYDANGVPVIDPTTGQQAVVTYQDKAGTSKIGGMITFNYHFANSDVLDAYGMLGAGYKNRVFTYESSEPGYEDETSAGSLFPVSFRIGAGMRYFFTENIGANLAIGFGQGGLINGGITAKF